MKSRYPLLSVILLSVFLGPPARASVSPQQMLEATRVALAEFQKAAPEHVEHFYGYKAWQSAEDAKIKIYVHHDGMEMEYNYQCQARPGKSPECQAL